MTAPAVLSNNSSSSTLTNASSSAPPDNNANATGDDAHACYYCSHLKLLRDVIPPKRCDYCRVWKCQFCTLKFPLLTVKKKVLPKIMKSNSRICIQCFSQHWQENGLSSATHGSRSSRGAPQRGSSAGKRASSADLDARESFVIDSSRPNTFIFDSGRGRNVLQLLDANRRESMAIDSMWVTGKGSFDDDSTRLSFRDGADDTDTGTRHRVRSASLEHGVADTTGASAPIVQSLTSAVDLWISIFAATIFAVIVVLEGYSLQQRVCFCVATYGVFLTLHPWFHAPKTMDSRSDSNSVTLSQASSSTTSGAVVSPPRRASVPAPTPTMTSVAEEEPMNSAPRALPSTYNQQKAAMGKTLAFYLSDECAWKVVKTTTGGIVSEMEQNDTPFPVFKIVRHIKARELFITGVPMADFVAFLDSKDVKDRGRWDLNVAKFEMIETFADAPGVSVCHNTQKSFLGGLVAARDFCLLYVRDGNCISFASIEHPRVPVVATATRGTVFLSCFHCHEAIGEDGTRGFILTYICQVDIGGSLPPKLLYNGSIDNMVKMIKVFKHPKKLLR